MPTNLREINTDTAKTITFIMLSTGLFELLLRASIQKMSVMGFEISDLSIIRKVLPMTTAYFLYQLSLLSSIGAEAIHVHEVVCRFLYEEISSQKLDYFQRPRADTLFGSQPFAYKPGFWTLGLMTAIFLGAIVFEVYAWYQQLVIFHADDLLTWVCLVMSFLFVFNAVRIEMDLYKVE